MLSVKRARLSRDCIYVFDIQQVIADGWTMYEMASTELRSKHLSARWGGPLDAGFRRERNEEVLAALGLVPGHRRVSMLCALA